MPSITQINEKEVFIFFSAFHCLFACSAVRSFFSSFRRANRLPHRRTHTRAIAQAPTKTEMLRIFRVYQLRREHEAGGEKETGGRPKYNSKINTDHDLLSIISGQRRAFLSLDESSISRLVNCLRSNYNQKHFRSDHQFRTDPPVTGFFLPFWELRTMAAAAAHRRPHSGTISVAAFAVSVFCFACSRRSRSIRSFSSILE